MTTTGATTLKIRNSKAQVPPGLSAHDRFHGPLGDAEVTSHLVLTIAIEVHGDQRTDTFGSQDCLPVVLATSRMPAPLRQHVNSVVGVGADEQVAKTRAVDSVDEVLKVALMKNKVKQEMKFTFSEIKASA